MSGLKYEIVEAGGLTMEDGAKELLNSSEMQPYDRYMKAGMFGGDIDASVREIAALPLEKRYVWRVASALKWGFADFDDWNVAVDRKTLQPEDFEKLMKLLQLVPRTTSLSCSRTCTWRMS